MAVDPEEVWREIRRKPKQPPAGSESDADRSIPLTDAGNAERIAQRHGVDLKHVPEWGWMCWDGRRFVRDGHDARKRATETARVAIHEEAAREADPSRQKELAGWARKSQAAPRIQGALWLAEASLKATTDDFDTHPWLLNVQNGTVDLRTGSLLPHRREHMQTRVAPVEYDENAPIEQFEKFLNRVIPDPDVRGFLQRAVGYSLTGLTVEQVLFFLFGAGRNGKSVFLELLLKDMLGEYAQAAAIATLTGHQSGIPNDVARLAGTRAVTVSETPEGARFNESLIKDLTGGDTITARFLRREYFDFRPQFKLWIRGNHKPVIRGTDDGIWRRVLLVPFNEQIPEAEVDMELPGKLRAELAGILAWAVRGCLDWQAEGLNPPQSITDETREYRSEMDTIGNFIQEECATGAEFKTRAKTLYAAYSKWAEDNGKQAVNSTRFGMSLAERGFKKDKQGVIYWHGIKAEGSQATEDSCPQCRGEGCAWCEGQPTT
jgi:putative DNA primase/helicase